MAKGSHGGWDGLPPEKRVCVGCGEKLTLRPPKGTPQSEYHRWALVFQEYPERRVWHHDCRDKVPSLTPHPTSGSTLPAHPQVMTSKG